jgi:hypothetical protein
MGNRESKIDSILVLSRIGIQLNNYNFKRALKRF